MHRGRPPKLGKASSKKKFRHPPPPQVVINDMTDDQEVAMKASFDNLLVVQKIIANLDFMELRAGRGVNKVWRNFATDELRRRDTCKVTINKHYRLSKFVSALKKQKMTNFPCAHFIFLGLNLGSVEAQQFFKFHGQKIKTLELGSCEGDEEVCGHILLKHAPNIEQLFISYPHNFPKFDEGSLSSLQELRWCQCNTENILRAAPNLKLTCDMDRTGPRLGQVTVCEKVSTYEKMLFYHSTKLLDPELIGFINAGPQIRHLEFCCYDDALDENIIPIALQVILQSSQDSLTSLDLTDFCEHLNEIEQFPVLTNVHLVQVGHYSSTPKRCFPSSMTIVSGFLPNLTTLDLKNVKCNEDINWQIYFPPSDNDYHHQVQLVSVQTLILNMECTEQWMIRLQSLCPSFKKLIITGGHHDQLAHMLLRVFRLWAHLEELDLTLSTDSVNLDPAFTGLPVRTCLQLESAVFERRENGFEKWRLVPSITNLKGLKRLRILFQLDPNGEGFTGKGVPLTKVTGMYAFQLMRDLKVSIQYDQNCRFTERLDSVFTSIAPYVNFTHKHDAFNDYEDD